MNKLVKAGKYRHAFESTFRRKLIDYMDPFTGFDLVKFCDEFDVEENTSCSDYIATTFGTDARELLCDLISI